MAEMADRGSSEAPRLSSRGTKWPEVGCAMPTPGALRRKSLSVSKSPRLKASMAHSSQAVRIGRQAGVAHDFEAAGHEPGSDDQDALVAQRAQALAQGQERRGLEAGHRHLYHRYIAISGMNAPWSSPRSTYWWMGVVPPSAPAIRCARSVASGVSYFRV